MYWKYSNNKANLYIFHLTIFNPAWHITSCVLYITCHSFVPIHFKTGNIMIEKQKSNWCCNVNTSPGLSLYLFLHLLACFFSLACLHKLQKATLLSVQCFNTLLGSDEPEKHLYVTESGAVWGTQRLEFTLFDFASFSDRACDFAHANTFTFNLVYICGCNTSSANSLRLVTVSVSEWCFDRCQVSLSQSSPVTGMRGYRGGWPAQSSSSTDTLHNIHF